MHEAPKNGSSLQNSLSSAQFSVATSPSSQLTTTSPSQYRSAPEHELGKQRPA
jgi:hypothetical protein